jgi:MoxR-like ATPase
MHEALRKIRDNLQSVIRGKNDRIDLLLAALLAEGHVLIEDLPGLGKTTLAKAIATSISGEFRRVQFTPDLLPTDVLGGSVYNATDGTFTFHRGPIFTNILLADEINRASPRTQSALLEAMAERQVSIEGRHHDLPRLFLVLATQNPIEFHGTYPLPEAQLDRFLIRMDLGYADAETERQILYDQAIVHPLENLKPAVERDQVAALQDEARRIHVAEEVGRYIVELVRATRQHDQVRMGASPRGALGLFRLSKALVLMDNRDHVTPDDIQFCAVPVLAHRLLLQTKAQYAGVNQASLVQEILAKVPVPT